MPGQIIWVLVEKSFGLGIINYEIAHLYSCHVLNCRVLLLESVERSRRATGKVKDLNAKIFLPGVDSCGCFHSFSLFILLVNDFSLIDGDTLKEVSSFANRVPSFFGKEYLELG